MYIIGYIYIYQNDIMFLLYTFDTVIIKKKTDVIWVCLKMSCTPTPTGFADHYPY